jgi:hypothetical protein
MRLRLPSLKSIVHGAHRMGATSNRFSVSQDEADRIRRAEAQGGHDAGLRVVLEILREKNATRMRDKIHRGGDF